MTRPGLLPGRGISRREIRERLPSALVVAAHPAITFSRRRGALQRADPGAGADRQGEGTGVVLHVARGQPGLAAG